MTGIGSGASSTVPLCRCGHGARPPVAAVRPAAQSDQTCWICASMGRCLPAPRTGRVRALGGVQDITAERRPGRTVGGEHAHPGAPARQSFALRPRSGDRPSRSRAIGATTTTRPYPSARSALAAGVHPAVDPARAVDGDRRIDAGDRAARAHRVEQPHPARVVEGGPLPRRRVHRRDHQPAGRPVGELQGPGDRRALFRLGDGTGRERQPAHAYAEGDRVPGAQRDGREPGQCGRAHTGGRAVLRAPRAGVRTSRPGRDAGR